MSYRKTPFALATPAQQKRRIIAALKRRGTVTWAAADLRISRRHLTRLLAELRIDPRPYRRGGLEAPTVPWKPCITMGIKREEQTLRVQVDSPLPDDPASNERAVVVEVMWNARGPILIGPLLEGDVTTLTADELAEAHAKFRLAEEQARRGEPVRAECPACDHAGPHKTNGRTPPMATCAGCHIFFPLEVLS